MRGWLHLLWPQLRSLKNAPKTSQSRERIRYLFFGLLGLGFMGLTGLGADWFFGLFMRAEFLSTFLIEKTLNIILVFFLGLLIFSNLIAGFSTLFLADDLHLLVSSPIPVGRLFLARMMNTWTQASWMLFVFGLPIFAAAGPALNAGTSFYFALPMILLPFTLLCCGIGCILTMLLARFLPAKNTRDVLIVLSVVGFLVLYIAFRLAEPETLLEKDRFQDLVGVINAFASAEYSRWLPSTWSLTAMMQLAGPDPVRALMPIMTLYLGAGGVMTLGAWLSRKIYLRAFDTAQTGRRPKDTGDTETQTIRRAVFPKDPVSALVRRDRQLFLRTTAQWTQLLLIGALVVVYLFNFKHFKALQEFQIIGALGIFYINLSLGGLVIITLCARFLYPAISLEGKAFWAVQVAPIPPDVLLRAKVKWGRDPMLLLGIIMASGASILTEQDITMSLISVGALALVTLCVCRMAVGMGAIWPQFHLDNPTRIASSLGGILFMIGGITYLLVMCIASIPVMVVIRDFLDLGVYPSANRQFWTICGVGTILILSGLIAWLPLSLGRKRLEPR